jgi:hypothetical protein
MTESNKLLIRTLIISLILALVVEHRIFTDSMAINDDARNQIYWMAKLINPNYFAGDYLANYFSQPSMISPVFKLLYQFGTYFADPKLISQFLPFPILLLTIFCLYKLAELHAGLRFAFWLCFVFNLYLWAMKFIVGGLPRSCFYLLFFLFLWMLAKKNWLGLNITAALQALIYPTAFFLSWVALIVELILNRSKPQAEKYKAVLSTFIISFSILCIRYLYHRDHSFGSLYSLHEAVAMPDFYYDHRHAVFLFPSSFMQLTAKPYLLCDWTLAVLPGILLAVVATVLAYLLISKVILAKAPALKLPRYLWSSTIASIFLFVIAHIFLFYLYLPHRFLAYVFPLIPVLLIATWFYKFEQLHSWKVYILAFAALALIAPRLNDDLISVSAQKRELYKFLSGTPIDSLIVAPMEIASDIPAFAYRSVLISSETDLFYHKLYHQEVLKRLELQNKIYAAKSIVELKNLASKYGIDYIVLNLSETTALTKPVFSTKKLAVIAI